MLAPETGTGLIQADHALHLRGTAADWRFLFDGDTLKRG